MTKQTLLVAIVALSISSHIDFGSCARLEMDQSQEHRHVSRHIHNEPNNDMRVVSLPLTGKKETTEDMKAEMAAATSRREHHLTNFLADMKSGTKVFQHFLSKSNLSEIVEDGSYMILIPADNAFQRWHPIDWGFYPFSVPEFTESVLRNHIIPTKNPLKLSDIKDLNGEQKFKALGGETITLTGRPQASANNVNILNGFVLPNGNTVLTLSEVLFVTEAVVSKLHQMHKDKETPPLLAFPWFGAQFLSHAFLALERDPRFSQITRFLNAAEVAPHVSGSNYTFFVPTDEAFERHGFDILTDDILASEKSVSMLLNHFVRQRLYDKDLVDGEVFDTIGGKPIKITRNLSHVKVNSAQIIEAEVFVYNLGTMFYIDDILYPEIVEETLKVSSEDGNDPDRAGKEGTTTERRPIDVEVFTVNNNSNESNLGRPMNDEEDSTDREDEDDDEIITPRALPVKYMVGV